MACWWFSYYVMSNSWDTMDCSLPGSSVLGILQALEWVAISFSRGSSWPRNWTQVPCIAGKFFTNWAMRKALRILKWVAMPSSRGSSQPREQTQVSHIAGRCFTFWATRGRGRIVKNSKSAMLVASLHLTFLKCLLYAHQCRIQKQEDLHNQG